jgi:hypothetical protein
MDDEKYYDDFDEELLCKALVYAGSQIDPPEYCNNDHEDDSEYCSHHLKLAAIRGY